MNSRASWIAVLCVGLAVAIAIKSFWRGDTDNTGPDRPSPPATPVRDVAGSRDESVRDREQQGQEDVAEPPTPSTIPVAHDVAVQGLEVPPDFGFSQTAKKFAAESKDPAWSDVADAHILSKLSRMTYLKAVYLEVDCRTTMCRVLIAPPDFPPPPWQLGELVYKLGLSPWQLQGDRRTMVTYLARDRLIWVDPPNDPFAR